MMLVKKPDTIEETRELIRTLEDDVAETKEHLVELHKDQLLRMFILQGSDPMYSDEFSELFRRSSHNIEDEGACWKALERLVAEGLVICRQTGSNWRYIHIDWADDLR